MFIALKEEVEELGRPGIVSGHVDHPDWVRLVLPVPGTKVATVA
jgi:hypothetical protein